MAAAFDEERALVEQEAKITGHKPQKSVTDKLDDLINSVNSRAMHNLSYEDYYALMASSNMWIMKAFNDTMSYAQDPNYWSQPYIDAGTQLARGSKEARDIYNYLFVDDYSKIYIDKYNNSTTHLRTVVPNPLSVPPNMSTGEYGEQIARELLEENGWTDFTFIKNNSDNGIDLIARGPDGQLGFFEVKTSNVGQVPQLSDRQANMDYFVNDILSNAANGAGRYKNIDIATQNAARQIYSEYIADPESVTGAVIGIDVANDTIRVSRWER